MIFFCLFTRTVPLYRQNDRDKLRYDEAYYTEYTFERITVENLAIPNFYMVGPTHYCETYHNDFAVPGVSYNF